MKIEQGNAPDALTTLRWYDFPEEHCRELKDWSFSRLGMTPQQMDRVDIRHVDTIEGNRIGMCDAKIDRNGRVDRCTIRIATSLDAMIAPQLELPFFLNREQFYSREGIYTDQPLSMESDPRIFCELVTPEQLMLATYLEEGHHAFYFLDAGWEQEIERRELEYIRYLKQNGLVRMDPYEIDIAEVLAGLFVAKNLAAYYKEQGDLVNSYYFWEKYESARVEGRTPLMTFRKLRGQIKYDFEQSQQAA